MTAPIDYDALLAEYGQAMYDKGMHEAEFRRVLAKEASIRAEEAIRALRAAAVESERDAGRYQWLESPGCYYVEILAQPDGRVIYSGPGGERTGQAIDAAVAAQEKANG